MDREAESPKNPAHPQSCAATGLFFPSGHPLDPTLLEAFQAPFSLHIRQLAYGYPEARAPHSFPHVHPGVLGSLPWASLVGLVAKIVSPSSSVPARSQQTGPRWGQIHFPAACCKEHSRFLTSLLVCWFISNTVTPLYSSRLVKSGLHIAAS